jgi:predicted ATPase
MDTVMSVAPSDEPKLAYTRLTDVRVFAGTHLLKIDPSFTVIMGRNNAGKSTILRALLLAMMINGGGPWHLLFRSDSRFAEVALRFEAAQPTELGVSEHDIATIRSYHLENSTGNVDSNGHDVNVKEWCNKPGIEIGRQYTGSVNFGFASLRGLSSEWSYTVRDGVNITNFKTNNNENTSKILHTNLYSLVPSQLPPFVQCIHFALWECHPLSATSWAFAGQPTRRLNDSNEDRLREVLVFLRLKHAKEFDRVSDALNAAFPEFERLDFIDERNQGFQYRPGFVRKSGEARPIAREEFGNGAWTYLCILTAARAAKATGARVLLLDEPQVYLHPGLEALLIAELTDPERWDNRPLQIVTATHSPTFVDAALASGTLNVLDWTDEARTSVEIRTVTATDAHSLFNDFTSRPGDLFYAQRILFVEGPGDVEAFGVLLRHVAPGSAVRIVPMRQTDAIACEVDKYFRVVELAMGPIMATRSLMILDSDKRNTLEKKWEAQAKEHRQLRTPVAWTSKLSNDLEALFIDQAFLWAYFLVLNESQKVSQIDFEREFQRAYNEFKPDAKKKEEKGCVMMQTLVDRLLMSSATKIDILTSLMTFYVDNSEAKHCELVKANLAGIVTALHNLSKS